MNYTFVRYRANFTNGETSKWDEAIIPHEDDFKIDEVHLVKKIVISTGSKIIKSVDFEEIIMSTQDVQDYLNRYERAREVILEEENHPKFIERLQVVNGIIASLQKKLVRERV